METRSCLRCKGNYQPAKGPQKYCLQLKTVPCPICGTAYSFKCSSKPNRTCSKSCSSRLIRREQAQRSTENCKTCDQEFHPQITGQLYCLKPLSISCEGGCGAIVETACSKSPKRFCTPSCRQRHIRATAYTIADRNCEICGELYSPRSSKSLACPKDHKANCRWCGEDFSIDIQDWKEKSLGQYCSNICSTLAQANSSLKRELTNEYKNIDQWAMDFREKHGKSPPT